MTNPEPAIQRPRPPRAPDDVFDAARRRSEARWAEDWALADALRAEIEAAGWKVVDRGPHFALEPAHPPTIEIDGRVAYGQSADVPSRLADPVLDAATIVVVATDWPADVGRALAGLEAHAPVGTRVVVVADGPSAEQAAALDAAEASPTVALTVEVVRTSTRLGQAAAVNCGVRRAVGDVVIVLDSSVEPTGDLVTPLVAALADPTVAVAGGWGLGSGDLRRFVDAPAGDVDAVEAHLLAFRRADYVERGPLDEKFRFDRHLDIWWSLALRDGGEDGPARRAVALAGLPAVRHEHRDGTLLPDAERDRQGKRNFYRVIDRFGDRRDLLLRPAPPAARSSRG